MSNKSAPVHPVRRFLIGSNIRRTLARAVVLGLLTAFILRYVWLPVRVRGVSMEPTFHDGAFHIANLAAFRFRAPARGDIVVIAMTGRRALYLKRLIGLPGDRIEFAGGALYLNGARVEEPYVRGSGDWTIPEVVVGPNEYYVAGDNRSIPWEQHTLGTVDRGKILGTILL